MFVPDSTFPTGYIDVIPVFTDSVTGPPTIDYHSIPFAIPAAYRPTPTR